MKMNYYHVDAFTDKLFAGNPAAVCVLPEWLPDDQLHTIAKENNLPVTAYLVHDNNIYHIRWITPEYELDLCGHGSLSASYVIFTYLNRELKEIKLQSRSEVISVMRDGDLITLNFPAKQLEPCSLPFLEQGLGHVPVEIYQYHDERCMAVFHTEKQVRQLRPDMQILGQLKHRGIVVTAVGDDVDFVSRTFYPLKTISEDPVTGASHCLLSPYWSVRLNKSKMHAKQVSQRGGELWCQFQGDRVLISGRARLYLQAVIQI